jgi:hypothetical protein
MLCVGPSYERLDKGDSPMIFFGYCTCHRAELGKVQLSGVYGLTGSSLLPHPKFGIMDGCPSDDGLLCHSV